MLFSSHLAAKNTAFSSILPCVQHQNALHLAPKRIAFSGILHCIQHQNALHFAANGPKSGASCGFMQCVFILPAFTCNPLFHQNKPSRESNFCGRMGGWWITKALLVLKILLKRLQQLTSRQEHGFVDKRESEFRMYKLIYAAIFHFFNLSPIKAFLSLSILPFRGKQDVCWQLFSNRAYKLLLIINKLHKQVRTNSGKVMSVRAFCHNITFISS